MTTTSGFIYGISDPSGLAQDEFGNIYVANYSNTSINKISSDGKTMTTIASGLSSPYGLAIDTSGNLYCSNYGDSTISKITANGNISTFVNSSSGLVRPTGLAFDTSGNLYCSSSENNTIYKVDPNGNSTIFVTDSQVSAPFGLVFDGSGNLYCACNGTGRIIKIGSNKNISTVASMSNGIDGPRFLAFDGSGQLYCTNQNNFTITKTVFNNGTYSTSVFARNVAAPALIQNPVGLIYNKYKDTFYCSTITNTTICEIPNVQNPVVSVFISVRFGQFVTLDNLGNLYCNGYHYDDRDFGSRYNIYKISSQGILSVLNYNKGSERLQNFNGLAFDNFGNLYCISSGLLRKINYDGTVSSYTTTGGDLGTPAGLVFDNSQNLYCCGQTSDTIYKIVNTTDSGTVSIFYDANLKSPRFMAIDVSGNLYCNSGNDIKQIPLNNPSQGTLFYNGLNFPLGLAFNESANYLYCSNTNANTIVAINCASKLGSVFVSNGLNYPQGLAYDNNLGKLYCSNSNLRNITVTLLPKPTLSNFSIPTKTYGNNPFTIVPPTSDSSGSFSYTSSNTNVATISGNIVTIVGAGNSIITAIQAATASYRSGTISTTFTVNKSPTTLGTFTVPAKAYGNSPFIIVPPTSNSDGLFSYTSSNTDVATISGNIVTIVGVGSSTITANQADTNNYNSASTTAVLNVSKGTPVLGTFTVPAKAYGNSPFIIVPPTSNSDGSFSYTSSNTDVATINENIITIVGVGSSTITAIQAATNNYNSASTAAVLNVSKGTPVLGTFILPVKFVGDSPFIIVPPTSNSDGSFSYTSSNTGVATILGDIITVIAIGESIVTATQEETATYYSATTTTNFVIPVNIDDSSVFVDFMTDTTATYGQLTNPLVNINSDLIASTPKVLNASSSTIITVTHNYYY